MQPAQAVVRPVSVQLRPLKMPNIKYENALAAMRDKPSTTFIFVLHPEAIAIRETKRAIDELSKLAIHNYRLIVNSIIPPSQKANALFAARAAMQAQYLEQIEADLPYPTQRMTLLSARLRGCMVASGGEDFL